LHTDKHNHRMNPTTIITVD